MTAFSDIPVTLKTTIEIADDVCGNDNYQNKIKTVDLLRCYRGHDFLINI